MSFIRTKTVNGHLYFYEQESKWVDGKVKSKCVRYLGASLATISGNAASKKSNRLTVDNIKAVPDKPGIYYLYNRRGTLIYVGAAERLRHRIDESRTEFNSAHYFRWRGAKTIEDAEILALKEIKQYDPKYNRGKP